MLKALHSVYCCYGFFFIISHELQPSHQPLSGTTVKLSENNVLSHCIGAPSKIQTTTPSPPSRSVCNPVLDMNPVVDLRPSCEPPQSSTAIMVSAFPLSLCKICSVCCLERSYASRNYSFEC